MPIEKSEKVERIKLPLWSTRNFLQSSFFFCLKRISRMMFVSMRYFTCTSRIFSSHLPKSNAAFQPRYIFFHLQPRHLPNSNQILLSSFLIPSPSLLLTFH